MWHGVVCHHETQYVVTSVDGTRDGVQVKSKALGDQCNWHSVPMVAMLIPVVDCTRGYT